MSHTFEGRYYPTTAGYEAAVRARDERLAREEATALRAHADAHRRQLRRVQEELDTAHADLATQRQLQQELEGHLADLAHTQRLLDAAVTRHAEHVRGEFIAVRGELADEVAAAERRQRELTAAVDAKVEADRQAVRAEQQTEADRTTAFLSLAGRVVASVAPRAARLGLVDELCDLTDRIARTGRESATGSRAAINSALEVDHRSDKLERKAGKREAELAVAANRLLAAAGRLKALLPTEQAAARLFRPEIREGGVRLRELEARARANYTTYADLQAHRQPDEAFLRHLEETLVTLAATAPAAVEWDRQRLEQAVQLVDDLERAGSSINRDGITEKFLTDNPARPYPPDDPKAPLEITIPSGGTFIKLRLPFNPLEGFVVDGYGHSSNGACQADAAQVARALAGRVIDGVQRVDGQARQQPLPAPPPPAAPWEGMAERLRKLGGAS